MRAASIYCDSPDLLHTLNDWFLIDRIAEQADAAAAKRVEAEEQLSANGQLEALEVSCVSAGWHIFAYPRS